MTGHTQFRTSGAQEEDAAQRLRISSLVSHNDWRNSSSAQCVCIMPQCCVLIFEPQLDRWNEHKYLEDVNKMIEHRTYCRVAADSLPCVHILITEVGHVISE